MILRWVSVCLAVCQAGLAMAQTVTVQSGEHEDFSRLVFVFPERTSYEVELLDNAARLVTGFDSYKFDVTRVFDFIPKTRLRNIEPAPTGGSVDLEFACDCEVSTFWHGKAYLVVDIAMRERSAAAAVPETPGSSGSETKDLPKTAPKSVTLDLDSERPSAAGSLAASGLETQTGPVLESGRKQSEDQGSPGWSAQQEIEESRDRLLRQISRATSQGLLTPAIQRPPQIAAPAEAAPVSPADETIAHADAETSDLQNSPANVQIHALTSIDRDILGAMSGNGAVASAVPCTVPAEVDVANWGSDTPFATQVATHRKALLGEFDHPNPATVLASVRMYLYFGFGAEAKALLETYGGGLRERDMLAVLAQVVQDGFASPGSTLAGQLECPEPTAFWSAMSYENLPTDRPLDVDAIHRTFASLPPHLRVYLGPILAKRLLAAGYDTDSGKITRVLERNTESENPSSDLVKAQVALKDGHTNTAENILDGIVERNAQPSAEALLKRIQSQLMRKSAISYDVAQLVGAYALENRGSPLGAELARGHVLALAASGAFDEALEELERLDEAGHVSGEIRPALAEILAETADEIDFLRHTLSGAAGPPSALKPEVANKISQRLLASGFGQSAASFLSSSSTGAAKRERQLLRAEVALSSGRPRMAIAELLGVDGVDADVLRARAHSMAGEHNAARHLYETAGLTEIAETESMLAGGWRNSGGPGLDQIEEPAEGDLTETGQVVAVAGHGVLAQNRELVAESGRTREALRTLLETHPVPDAKATRP